MEIIRLLRLPELVMPVATITLGWPAEDPAPTDRLPLTAIRHDETYCPATADSIDRDPPGTRHISGLTLGISQEGYERIVERINAFRKEIALLAEEDEGSDKVFQLEFALFPVGGK